MKTELKPCPFCGGEAEEKSQTASLFNTRNVWYIRCKSCHSTGEPKWHPKQAIEAWNRRAEDESRRIS